MSQSRNLEINREWCKGCRICVAFCPKQVLELDAEGKAFVARPDDCIWCRDCEIRCPDMAITIVASRAS
jgi:2-oxoglutarate ferredoxin oxidoreductase subunit delta